MANLEITHNETMIAASDPQEFVPSGRRQAQRYLDNADNEASGHKFNILHSLNRTTPNDDGVWSEWWTIRKAPVNWPTAQNTCRSSVNHQKNATPKCEKDVNQSSQSDKSMTYCSDTFITQIDTKCRDGSFRNTNKRRSETVTPITMSTKRISGGDFSKGNCLDQGEVLPIWRVNDAFPMASEDDVYVEDELYVSYNTVIWSRGLLNNYDNIDNGRMTLCAYTSPMPVKQALWCNFYCERPVFDLSFSEQSTITTTTASTSATKNTQARPTVTAVCIVDDSNIRVFAENGEDFVIAVPFEIKSVWSVQFGIIIERKPTTMLSDGRLENNKASLFSLAYPLDEICPVTVHHMGSLQIMNNPHRHIVHTDSNPSVCMVYDPLTKRHSVYAIRKLGAAEKLLDTTQSTLMTQCHRPRSHLSLWESGRSSLLDGGGGSLTAAAPTAASRPPSAASLLKMHSCSQMALSRCQSPRMTLTSASNSPWLMRQQRLSLSGSTTETATPSGATGAVGATTFAGGCGAFTRSYFDCSRAMSYMHASPNLCLDHLWTDHITLDGDERNDPATKVFFYTDFSQQRYMCYMLTARSQVVVVKVTTNADRITGFNFLAGLSARDVVLLPQLHMVAILEMNGNIVLYSGVTAVGKLHVGGTLVAYTPSPQVRRRMYYCSPFPRRSSLLPFVCNQSSDPKFDEHLLSPVLPTETMDVSAVAVACSGRIRHKSTVNLPPLQQSQLSSSEHGVTSAARPSLSGFVDAVGNHLTFTYSDATCYRITLPKMAASFLVDSCLLALRQCLSGDATNSLFAKWYAVRNALGTEAISDAQEWTMFMNFLCDMMGYQEVGNQSANYSETPSVKPKRQKHSEFGTDNDWLYLKQSTHQECVFSSLQKILNIYEMMGTNEKNSTDANNSIDLVEVNMKDTLKMNTTAPLFTHIKRIFISFHLLYEDFKLNVLFKDSLLQLAKLLHKLACDLGFSAYSVHYWKDFPEKYSIQTSSNFSPEDLNMMENLPGILNGTTNAVSIFQFIYDLLNGKVCKDYPFLRLVNNRSRDVIQICDAILQVNSNGKRKISEDSLIKTLQFVDSIDSHRNEDVLIVNDEDDDEPILIENAVNSAALLLMKKNYTVRDLDTFPIGIYLLFYASLWKCRENPPSGWPSEVYYLMWREDLAAQAEKHVDELNADKSLNLNTTQKDISCMSAAEVDVKDGMEELDSNLMKLRFADDVRVSEARKMLQSSQPVAIRLVQRPDVSDHDFIEEQEKHLLAICTRTMALPTGRGMVTLRTASPVITEPLSTPVLCLSGRATPKGTTIELNHIDTPSNMNLWPLFHNGVANGLRISTTANNINNSWIIFNKPKSSVEQQMEHAGFLMALGLNGHLRNLEVLSTCNYLIKVHEMTSIGILVGLAAAFRGTADHNLTKALSIHVEALLPPTSMEVDVPQNMQVASLLSVGLLYQGTAHRHTIEVLLSEIGRPPGPEMENSVDRESYSLAAGLALGFVTLRQGGCPASVADLNVADTLHYYMIGGNRRAFSGAQKDKYRVPSFQIREGLTVNLDVSSPGATIALGLMYFATHNKAVADWMAPPETQYLLDFIRPDFLLFRILARCLILWDDVVPTKEWVEGQVPDTIRLHCMVRPASNADVDYEAMNQAYCNIITGACFALGLKFAGSADEDAFETLLHFCHAFTRLTVKSIAELAGKPTVETCLNVLLLSAAMVMAGTGNVDVMRLIRHLRRRVGVASSAVVTYGSHLATHMALGLLFLGGGRYTFSNSAESIAALICAFYPKFPTHSNDNRYHLQCFRHLYVLAVEPRIVIPKDVQSGSNCYASLNIVKLNGTEITVRAPCIIPSLKDLLRITVDDDRYWPVVFERGRNWDALSQILCTTGCIEVKQRAGCLSYEMDKLGHQSQLARTLAQSGILPWDPSVSSVLAFTYDKAVRGFCEYFLVANNDAESTNTDELKILQHITKMVYESVVKDKLVVIPVFTTIVKLLQDLKKSPHSTLDIWQIKLIAAQTLNSNLSTNLLSKEVILAVEDELEEIIDNWQPNLALYLLNYVNGSQSDLSQSSMPNEYQLKLATYITYYDIPFKFDIGDHKDSFELLSKFNSDEVNSKTVFKLMELFNCNL